MKTVFIYALKDPRDGAVRYIGKAKDPKRRLYLHLREAKKGKIKTHKNYWVGLLLSLGETPEMELLDQVPDFQQNFFERAYIKVYRELGTKLTNLTDGGDGGATTTGRKLSPERCAAISARNKGVPKTLEHRAALSSALIGRPVPEGKACRGGRKPGFKQTEDTKAKISATRKTRVYVNPMLGRRHTPESKAKQSDLKKGKGVGKDNPFFGQKHTEESKALIRAARLAAVERKKQNVLR